MTKKEFMKIAKECIKECMKPIAFDANLAQKYKDVPPVMEKRLKRYLKLWKRWSMCSRDMRHRHTVPLPSGPREVSPDI